MFYKRLLMTILIIVQRDATQSSLFIILQVQLYMFRVSTTPIIRSTQNCNYSLRYWSYFYVQLPPSNVADLGQAWPHWREVDAQKLWPVPEALVTVLCTPDDGCGWPPKHVEWTCRIINRLLCVASRWTIIHIFEIHVFLLVFLSNFIHLMNSGIGTY